MRPFSWFSSSTRARRALWLAAIALGVSLFVGSIDCVRDSRDLHAARKAPERWPSGIGARSWPLCSLIGPHNQNAGVWGTDLGFSARAQNDPELTLLFGDTWATPVNGCQYPPAPNNDLVGTMPVKRPSQFSPGAPASRSQARAQTCDFLKYSLDKPDDATSWRRARLFASITASRDDATVDMSGLRTPTAAFSDGEKLFALFLRFDPALCKTQSDCPTGMQCSSDPEYRGLPVGACGRIVKPLPDASPDYCRDSDDCLPFADCNPIQHGLCMAREPFEIDTPRGRIAPAWYRDDPKRAIARVVHVAAAIWPDRPADYATVARFTTNRFLNVAARTVAYFDPQHPEKNDYRPGYHTLLLWGRNSFVESEGVQTLPFLLYVPLEDLRVAPEKVVWRPRFFAGYGSDGNPAWSERESDAKPIYGSEARLANSHDGQIDWSEPEFDLVAQMSLSWVAPLSRWVMLYGGDLPAFMVAAPKTFKTRDAVNLQWASGAIHMRVAEHPWGAASVAPSELGTARDASAGSGWSSAKPILTRELAAPYLACGEEGPEGLPGCVEERDAFRSLTLIGALASSATREGFGEVVGNCLFGEAARATQDTMSGNMIGRLYAPNIVDEWTEDVTDAGARARGERSAEIYWNVSTWNPYQVVLLKTRLTSSVEAGGRELTISR